LQLKNMPCEFVQNFDPNYPIILGGLLSGETNHGFVQVRIKKHRWYPKILKSRNPLIISLGWRRFQTMPLYSMQDHNGRDRSLKYTPLHLHCYASFYGPITPQGTGFVAIQDSSEFTNKFRLAATGNVLNLDRTVNVVKKLKLVGQPMRIHKKTAFIRGMFNSALEAAKFEGALVKTVSGIRGHIKKSVSKPEGSFRATFEDKILLSDIVFLRSWYTVDIPRFYYPVPNLLLRPELKQRWQGMKTVGQLRHEQGVTVAQNPDSFYTIMERKKFSFKPLHIPKTLEQQLPFRNKSKFLPKKENKVKRVAVIREPEEQRVATLQKRIRAMYKDNERIERKQLNTKNRKKHQENAKKLVKQQESMRRKKKAICKKLSQHGRM
jgi:ribosome biogenesis protein BMS1